MNKLLLLLQFGQSALLYCDQYTVFCLTSPPVNFSTEQQRS
jgi:hypothetical protein